MTASIGESLTLLAQVAGVPLRGLDDDQLDIVALRLVIESKDQPVLTCIGRIVDEVRQANGGADLKPPGERGARLTLVASLNAEDVLPDEPSLRRPEIVHVPDAPELETQERSDLGRVSSP